MTALCAVCLFVLGGPPRSGHPTKVHSELSRPHGTQRSVEAGISLAIPLARGGGGGGGAMQASDSARLLCVPASPGGGGGPSAGTACAATALPARCRVQG